MTWLSKNKATDLELIQLKQNHQELNEVHSRLRKDNHRMKFLMVSNNKKCEAMNEDVEFYKFRIQEMKLKYQESSSDEEDAVKKVLRKNRPVNKETDVHDLEEYIEGLPIDAYRQQEEELDENAKAKADELKRQKQRKLPKSIHCQTDPPPGNDFGIQIVEGEEVISFVDTRVKSAPHKNLEKLHMLSNEQLLKAGLVEQHQLEAGIQRSFSLRDLSWGATGDDLSRTVVQKVVTNTDLHKIKSVDGKLYSKLLLQFQLNQGNYDELRGGYERKLRQSSQLETRLRMVIKALKQQAEQLRRQAERTNFEKSWLEAENYELRDNLEIIKIRASQNEFGELYPNRDFEPVEFDENGKPKKLHFCHGIIKKVKDKKLEKLVLKMPKTSVLKLISKFEEHFEKYKNVEGDTTMAEITYDSFLQKYGLQNVADLKYKRFLVALRVYAFKDGTVKAFAQSLGLIDQS